MDKRYMWVAKIRCPQKDIQFIAQGEFVASEAVKRELDLDPDDNLAEWFEAVYDKVADMFRDVFWKVDSLVVMEAKPDDTN